MGLHFYTSITANFLAKARVLAKSVLQFHPSATFHVVLCDRVPSWFSLHSEPFHYLYTLADIGVPNLTSWVFQHDLVELCTAVKGFALQKLLAREDCNQVIYLDPDILVLAPFDKLLRHFDDASILLTTHQSEPETTYDAVADNELLTLQHGTFNLGFLGVKNSVAGHRFADWWAERLRDFCFDDIPIGLFTDQRWPDLVPSFFPDHNVIRDPVYNVSGWNLTSRRVDGSVADGFTVNGESLVFFHFSGIDSGREWTMLQRYGRDMPALLELRDWYLRQCSECGDDVLRTVPWAYGYFADGEPILRSQRTLYRIRPHLQAAFPDPFQCFPSQLDPAVEAKPTEEHPEPYRIFLLAAPDDLQYVDETLASLGATTVRESQVWLVTRSLTRQVPSIAVDADRYDDLASHVLQNFADQDIILLRAGAQLPPQWDLRLAWTAARHPSALTVSPLDRRIVDESGLFASYSNETFDSLCYYYRPADDLEVPYFSRDCVFIRGAGVRGVAANRRQLALHHLLDDAVRLRWQHIESGHLCVAFECSLETDALSLAALSRRQSILTLRNALRSHPDRHAPVPRHITSAMTGATLHVSHSWGGGVEQWVQNFAEADTGHEQFLLKAIGPKGAFGSELQLYRYGSEGFDLLESIPLAPVIRATAIAHTGYRQQLQQILRKFGVSRIVVSSLIGHSLDCLRSTLPTVFVAHDYYPFCSAVNLTFGEICPSCEAPRLAACLSGNGLNSSFPNVVHSEWLALRSEFLAALEGPHLHLIAPSPSVKENYTRMVPSLADRIQVISHGLPAFDFEPVPAPPADGRPLRLLSLGALTPHKGVLLLKAMLPDLLSFAELTVAGTLDNSNGLADNPGIRLIPDYKREELPALIADVQPDLALFLSIWPETFSYTLHEIQRFGIPPVATNAGGFRDAIEEGRTGFLCEPDPLSFLARLRHLAAHRDELAAVQSELSQLPRRSVAAMVADYAALAKEDFSPDRYFTGPHVPAGLTSFALQLYWEEQDVGLSEATSYTFAPTHTARQLIHLFVPALRRPLLRLRFDPGSSPSVIEISRLQLCLKTGEVLWSCSDIQALLASASHARAFALSSQILAVSAADPQIELPVPVGDLARLSRIGGYLAVECAWIPIESQIGEMISGSQALTTEINRTRRDLAASEASLTLSHERWQRSQSEMASSRTELDDVREELATRQAELATLHLELANLRDEANRISSAETAAHERSQALESELARLNTAHRRLLQSLSWQITKPVRGAAELTRKLIGKS